MLFFTTLFLWENIAIFFFKMCYFYEFIMDLIVILKLIIREMFSKFLIFMC